MASQKKKLLKYKIISCLSNFHGRNFPNCPYIESLFKV